MTLALGAFLLLCSLRVPRRLVSTGKRNGKNHKECMGRPVLVDTVAQVHAHTDMPGRTRSFS